MISTLQDLIAPLTEAEFLTHLRERTVAFVRTSEPHRFETLLDWDDLNHLVQSGVYPIEELRVRESMSDSDKLLHQSGSTQSLCILVFDGSGRWSDFQSVG